jgi:hypothetical protein
MGKKKNYTIPVLVQVPYDRHRVQGTVPGYLIDDREIMIRNCSPGFRLNGKLRIVSHLNIFRAEDTDMWYRTRNGTLAPQIQIETELVLRIRSFLGQVG